MENVYNVDEQELVIEPKNLRWSNEGGYQTAQLRNITENRLAIKVPQYSFLTEKLLSSRYLSVPFGLK